MIHEDDLDPERLAAGVPRPGELEPRAKPSTPPPEPDGGERLGMPPPFVSANGDPVELDPDKLARNVPRT